MLHRVGSQITVERFRVGLTSLKFFRDLTHRLSITVFAESVASQEEKHTLEKLFIERC